MAKADLNFNIAESVQLVTKQRENTANLYARCQHDLMVFIKYLPQIYTVTATSTFQGINILFPHIQVYAFHDLPVFIVKG